MTWMKLLCLFCLITGILVEKLPDGVCVTKIIKGKIVRVGDCEVEKGEQEMIKDIRRRLAQKQQAESTCVGVSYKFKCYRAVVYNTYNVSFNDAESLCKTKFNRKPANIYDMEHYRTLENYLRQEIATDETWIVIWTGLVYKNDQLQLTTGEPVTLPWHPSHPSSVASYTNVVIVIRKDAQHAEQGIANVPPLHQWYGVICEI